MVGLGPKPFIFISLINRTLTAHSAAPTPVPPRRYTHLEVEVGDVSVVQEDDGLQHLPQYSAHLRLSDRLVHVNQPLQLAARHPGRRWRIGQPPQQGGVAQGRREAQELTKVRQLPA